MSERTERGFRVFHKSDDLSVVESSLAFEGTHVRIYGGRGGSNDHVHLSYEQAGSVIAALKTFCDEAEQNLLCEPIETAHWADDAGDQP